MSTPMFFAAPSELRSAFPIMKSSVSQQLVLELGNGGKGTHTNKDAAMRGHCLAHMTKDGQSFCIGPVMDDET